MKRLFSICLIFLLLTGCGKEALTQQPAAQTSEPEVQSAAVKETTAEPAVSFDWSQLKNYRFLFASGAGAWGTVLYIDSDGSFSGNYHDSEATTGPGYPNGSVYYCNFTGQFSQPVQMDPNTYSFRLENIQYQDPAGTEEIRDGVLYQYVSAYGLTDTEEFRLYLPGTPVDNLPEYFQLWFGYELEGIEALPFYGLFNTSQEQCFSGKDMVQQIYASIAAAEEAELEIEANLQEAYTQADMNMASYNRYLVWDGVLNELWALLKQLLPEEEMRQLTNEELAWIGEKEQTVAEAGAEYEGGSLQSAVINSTAANLTRERVYELLQYLP